MSEKREFDWFTFWMGLSTFAFILGTLAIAVIHELRQG